MPFFRYTVAQSFGFTGSVVGSCDDVWIFSDGSRTERHGTCSYDQAILWRAERAYRGLQGQASYG
jgi:hypothetical protein